jgi:hypothetical protein
MIDDIRAHLETKPFVPFLIQMNDGRTIQVPHLDHVGGSYRYDHHAQIEAAACKRLKIPERKWEEAKKRFPSLLPKVNRKQLRRMD